MADSAGALLLRHGMVKPDQIASAHQLQKRDGGSFGECLVRIGAIDEDKLVEFYHKRLMIPRLPDAKLMIVSPKVLGLVPSDMAAEFRVLPVEVDNEGTLTLAMSDPTSNHAVDEVAFFADRFILRAVASESALRKAIETHYGVRFGSPRTSDRVATEARVTLPPAPRPAPIADAPQARILARQQAKQPPKPTREELDQQIVLLTKVKRSEETPLPMPIPPPDDYVPEYAHREESGPASEPILLTKPKNVEIPIREGDTLRDVHEVVADPPLAQIRAAQKRDEIARLVLEYISLLTRRAVFFVIKKELLVGQDARGFDAELARKLAIQIDQPSIFRDVIASRLPYRGPMPETQANRAFARAIGGVGTEVLLMPIAIRERIIALLFADTSLQPLPDAALHATTREAGLAYERLLLQSKR